MSATRESSAPVFAGTLVRHSLGWLVAANFVGIWLGVGLVWPAAGNWLSPLTWGRWAPLHMNWQLYGWCALPLVGALLTWFFEDGTVAARDHARIGLTAWSLALAFGGAAWLAGSVSGKLFLDWHGATRPLLPLAMLVLWSLLAWHTHRRWVRLTWRDRAARAIALALLCAAPFVLFWATGRGMYHPINPDSGGATGAAVLGSTLGVITIFMSLPHLLGLTATRPPQTFVVALAASWVVFAVTDRGHVSHHHTAAIVALATLLGWVPLLPSYWKCYDWPSPAKPWLVAASAWWTLLVLTGWVSFLPGISEALKFTHALVGHAHLAMAGLVTCVNAAILVVVTRRAAPRGVFTLWQAGCAIYVGAMIVLGWGEVDHAGELYRSEAWTQALLTTRLVAGIAMAAASLRWWRASFAA